MLLTSYKLLKNVSIRFCLKSVYKYFLVLALCFCFVHWHTKNAMKIVTGGAPFIDIDAYACIVAYTELLNKQNIKAKAFTTSLYNESITETVQSWQSVSRDLKINSKDSFIVLDASNPKCIEKKVSIKRLEKVIDHRYEFVDMWQKTGVEPQIERIGAAATYIYEEWQKTGLTSVMSVASARLLYTAVIDNTLNLGSKITTNRDKRAYEHLRSLANLPINWPEKYFKEVEKAVLTDVQGAIGKDTKLYTSPNLPKQLTFMQLCVWDVEEFIQTILSTLNYKQSIAKPWLMNLIAIKQNRSFFVADSSATAGWLHESLGLKKASKNVYKAKRMYLRKEVIEKDRKRAIK